MGKNVAPNVAAPPKGQEPALAERIASCAKRLEEAAAIRISIHDSDSRVSRINEQRLAVMLEVARELRALT